MKLIIGLGNPGKAYSGNRHNVGFTCISNLARRLDIRFSRKAGMAKIGLGEIGGQEVLLAKPQTYMNLSGRSVTLLMKTFKAKLEDIIIIHDDIDLPLGSIRVRKGGGSGGQRGIKSIFAETGSREFTRVRVGIGRPEGEGEERTASQTDVVNHVLSGFTAPERKVLEEVVPRAGDATICLVEEGLEKAMTFYNRPFAKPQDE